MQGSGIWGGVRRGVRGLSALRVHSPRFEEEQHFRVLVKMAAQELANGVPDSGHLYASIRANKTLTPAGDLQETFSGMEQVPGWPGSLGPPRVAGILPEGPRFARSQRFGRAPSLLLQPPTCSRAWPWAGRDAGPPAPECPSLCVGPLAQVRLMKSIAEMADVKPVLSQLLLIKDHMLDRENMR